MNYLVVFAVALAVGSTSATSILGSALGGVGLAKNVGGQNNTVNLPNIASGSKLVENLVPVTNLINNGFCIIKDVSNYVVNVLGKTVPELVPVLSKLKTALGTTFQGLEKVANETIAAVTNNVKDTVDLAVADVGPLLQIILTILGNASPLQVLALNSIIENITLSLPGAAAGLAKLVVRLVEGILLTATSALTGGLIG